MTDPDGVIELLNLYGTTTTIEIAVLGAAVFGALWYGIPLRRR